MHDDDDIDDDDDKGTHDLKGIQTCSSHNCTVQYEIYVSGGRNLDLLEANIATIVTSE